MQKVVVNEKTRENTKFQYNDVEIELIPYISAELELKLISLYVQKYFSPIEEETFGYLKDGQFDYWQAEYSLAQTILDDLTNVNAYEVSANTVLDIFGIVSNDHCIGNFFEVMERLYGVIEAIKDSKSIGIVLDGLVTNVKDIIQSFQNIDPEQLKSLADSLIGKMESSSIAPVFQEAAKQTVINDEKKSKTRKVKENKE